MAVVDQPKNLVEQSTLSTGTGNLTLAQVDGRQSFNDAFGTGGSDKFWYFITALDGSGTDEWEVGTGHLSDATTLVRDTVVASSNADALVDFAAGQKRVTNDLEASEQVGRTLAQTLTNKTLDLASNTFTGTKAEFDAAVSDGNIAYAGGAHHDGFSDFVADEHVAHSSVSITAGAGLTGGGTIAATRTLAVAGVLATLFTLGVNASDGEFLVGTGADALAWESGATARTSLGLGSASAVTFGSVTLGVADTTQGLVSIHGAGTGSSEGGQIDIYMAADHDGTYDAWHLDVFQTALRFFTSVGGQALTLNPSTLAATIYGAIELGHASDTTIARSSAGVVTIEGVTVATASNSLTLTSKTIDSANNTLTLDLGEGTLTGTAAEFDTALQSDTFVFTSEVGSVVQAYDAELTALAALTTTAAGRSALEIADPGADRIIAWDDTAGVMAAIALADLTAEASPASGDFFLIYGAEGDLRKVDVDDLPGGGGGLSNVVEDTTPQLGGALDGQGFDLNNMGVLFLTEQAAAEVDVAGKGQFWVQTATPNLPMFTDDAGTDRQLATLTGANTFTNKRVTPRTSGTNSSPSPSPSADNDDFYWLANMASNPTFAAPSGTPTQGQRLIIRLRDNGTSRSITWNSIYRGGSDFALPAATDGSSGTMYLTFMYNVYATKWDLVARVNGI